MKIVDNIVLLARDVPIKLPAGATWIDTKSEWRIWAVVGVHCSWRKAEGGYVCPMIQYEPRAWMNVAREESTFCSRSIVPRDDKDAIYGNLFEEVVLALQLDGSERNVFEIPLKVARDLEERAVKQYGRWQATSFVLPFKWLKTKCRRII